MSNDSICCILTTLPVTCSTRCRKHLAKLKLEPKAVYENLDSANKAQVQTALKSYAGVYVILNLVNGNTYVGSAITGRMGNRFHKHLFANSGNKLVYSAVQKYGLNNFAFIVADTINNVVTQEENRELLDMEDSYIQRLQPEYNIAPTAGNTFGVKHTEQTKEMMRLNYSSERRESIGALNRGKNLSPATIEKIREAAIKRGPLSVESRARVSANSGVAYY